ncbi:hypothetical protein [Pseudoalteromonas sp.]|uniref:hypothetical protein n=1 Tax=Pseudoalteromonas sp. TaxID=53249 RepID=UPI003561E13D
MAIVNWFKRQRKSKLAFYTALIATPTAPVIFAIWQYLTVGYAIDFGNGQYWSGVTKAFNFQIEMMKILAGLTAMLGLLYRSLQTQEQINTARLQLDASLRKDNFSMYIEHFKLFSDELEHTFNKVYVTLGSSEKLHSDTRLLYSKFYKPNTPQNGVVVLTPTFEDCEKLSKTCLSLMGYYVQLFYDTASNRDNIDKNLKTMGAHFRSAFNCFANIGLEKLLLFEKDLNKDNFLSKFEQLKLMCWVLFELEVMSAESFIELSDKFQEIQKLPNPYEEFD